MSLPPDQFHADPDRAYAHFAALVSSSQDAIISKSTDGVIQTWNAAAERMFGYTANEIIGKSIRILIPEDRQDEEDHIIGRIRSGENVTNFETIRLRKDRSPISVSVTVSPIHDRDGQIVGASKIVRDVSDLVVTLDHLRQSEERFRTLADNMSQFAWMAQPDGYIFWYNKRWYDYTGTTLEDMKGWGWRQVHHPDHVDRVVQRIQHSWDTGEPWEDTFPLRSADGEYRWFLSRALPIRDESGNIVRWFGSNTDITEQKQHEEQIGLLLGEVNHRSKNMLALVQAIARQTAGPGDEEFVRRFSSRLQSLASSQDLLVNSGWRGAKVTHIVRAQLEHFADLIGKRISIDGPDVTLTSAAAQTLGLALHELATNAGKYGALSNEAGRVDITWRILGENGSGRFQIDWVERDGPQTAPPERRGFGSTIITRMTELALGGETSFDFRPEGLVWTLTCKDGRALEHGQSNFQVSNALDQAFQPDAGKTVLLVEDEPVIGLDIATALEDSGYAVVGPAASVQEALSLLQEYRCDYAVLDINLGPETSEGVAKKLLASQIPFLTLSGYTGDQKPAVFSSVPHLSKPLRTNELISTLRDL